MQKTKILAVAPYEGMADILTDIAQSRDDIALTVQTGDLFTGRDIAMQLAHKNYDVIISRGGTAELIQSAVELPVIDISISVYDILLSELINLAPKKIVIHNRNLFENSQVLTTIENIFENNVTYCDGCSMCSDFENDEKNDKQK